MSAKASAQTNTFPSSGKVGIGTLTPEERLQVKGNVHIDSSLYVNDSLTIGKKLILNQDLQLRELAVPGASETDLDVVVADMSGIIRKWDLPTLQQALYLHTISCDPSYTGSSVWSSSGNKIFTSSCPENVRVGIRTANPRSVLDVIGDVYGQSLLLGDIEPGSAPALSGLGRFQMKTDLGAASDAAVFKIENQSKTILQLQNDGLLRAREIKVDMDTWPDYVFDKNYKLRTLSEVEAFIGENGHLPAVPSAREVEDEGMNLGEMNKILLEKIEELTLYLIEQEKRIRHLENELK